MCVSVCVCVCLWVCVSVSVCVCVLCGVCCVVCVVCVCTRRWRGEGVEKSPRNEGDGEGGAGGCGEELALNGARWTFVGWLVRATVEKETQAK